MELGYEFSGVDKPKNELAPYSLRYADFVVPLVKAVQEQQAMIDSLQTENAQLKVNQDQVTAELNTLKQLAAEVNELKATLELLTSGQAKADSN